MSEYNGTVYRCDGLYLQPEEDGCQNSSQDDAEQLEPVEKWDTYECRVLEVVKRWVQQDDKGEEEQEPQPASASALTALSLRASLRTVEHEDSPFAICGV